MSDTPKLTPVADDGPDREFLQAIARGEHMLSDTPLSRTEQLDRTLDVDCEFSCEARYGRMFAHSLALEREVETLTVALRKAERNAERYELLKALISDDLARDLLRADLSTMHFDDALDRRGEGLPEPLPLSCHAEGGCLMATAGYPCPEPALANCRRLKRSAP